MHMGLRLNRHKYINHSHHTCPNAISTINTYRFKLSYLQSPVNHSFPNVIHMWKPKRSRLPYVHESRIPAMSECPNYRKHRTAIISNHHVYTFSLYLLTDQHMVKQHVCRAIGSQHLCMEATPQFCSDRVLRLGGVQGHRLAATHVRVCKQGRIGSLHQHGLLFLLDLGVSSASVGVSEDCSQIPQDGVQDWFGYKFGKTVVYLLGYLQSFMKLSWLVS